MVIKKSLAILIFMVILMAIRLAECGTKEPDEMHFDMVLPVPEPLPYEGEEGDQSGHQDENEPPSSTPTPGCEFHGTSGVDDGWPTKGMTNHLTAGRHEDWSNSLSKTPQWLQVMRSKYAMSSHDDQELEPDRGKDSHGWPKSKDRRSEFSYQHESQQDGGKSKAREVHYELDSELLDEARKWQHHHDLRKNWWLWRNVASKVIQSQQEPRWPGARKYTPDTTDGLVTLKWPTPSSTTLAPPVALSGNQPVVEKQHHHDHQAQTDHHPIGNPSSGLQMIENNEIEQQHQLHSTVMIHPNAAGSPNLSEGSALKGWDYDTGSGMASMPGASRESSKPLTGGVRARESLLNAAEIARQIGDRNQKGIVGPASPSSSLSKLQSGSPPSSSAEEAQKAESVFGSVQSFATVQQSDSLIYLGQGQLQRTYPFKGNNRTQARLSCQFGDPSIHNVTISEVTWAKFSGNYSLTGNEPSSFECPRDRQMSAGSCPLELVQTNVSITVHPRPAVQNYLNVLVPSYSVTLHDVSQDQYGVYRCSAKRQYNDRFGGQRTETVYRLIPFQ